MSAEGRFVKLSKYGAEGSSILICPNCGSHYLKQEQMAIALNNQETKILFECENCGSKQYLVLEMSKGSTLVHWQES